MAVAKLLFTSSSKLSFFPIFGIALIILTVGYYVVAESIPDHWTRIVNLQQANTIRAEELLFSDKKYEVVLVGTSLTVRLQQEFLPEQYYNLGISGGSIYSGLEIVTNLEKTPQLVIIETNYLLNNLDSSWTSSLLNSFQFTLKKYVPIFQEKYHPFSRMVGPVMSEAGKKLMGKVNDNKDQQVDQKLFYTMLSKKQKKWHSQYKASRINNKLKVLEKYLQRLEDKGISVLLHEMPMHETLSNSPRMLQVRKALREQFPKKYFISTLSSDEVTTSDGNHLNRLSAKNYVKNLVLTVNKQVALKEKQDITD